MRRSTNQKINLFCRYCITKISFFTNMIDKLNKVSKSNVAYHFWCSDCESSYIGKSDFLKHFVLFLLDKFEFKVHQDVDFWISFYFLFQGYLDAKNLRYSLIPCRDFDYQEPCNLTEQEAQLATSNQKLYHQIITFADGYFHEQNVRYWLIPCIGTDDERILQFYWTRGKTGHTQPKVVYSDGSFLLWLSPFKKSKVSIDSLQIYWWSKNPAIWFKKWQN